MLAGVTYSYGAGDRDVYLIKTNSSGDTLWTRVYGGPNIDNVFTIKPTFDSGYVLAGWSSSRSGDDRDMDCYILKIDSLGMLQWQNYCSDSSNSGAYDIVQADNGDYLMAGGARILDMNILNFDLFVVRANEVGDTVWTRRYVIPGRELWDGLAYSIIKTFDSCFIIAGEIYLRNIDRSDMYIIKIDNNGDTVWTKIIDYQSRDYAWDCVETPDGDIVLAGYVWDGYADTAGDEIYLAKLTSAGDILWQKTFAYPWPVSSYNDAWAVAVDPADKGYIIVADTRPQMIYQRDIYVIKTDRYGDTLWTWKNDSASDEAPSNIAVMGNNSFAVCGFKYNYVYKDFYLLVFKPSSPVGPDNPAVPNMIELGQNYPNPFNAATIIKYNLSVAAQVNLDIYNYLGQKVTNLVNEDQRPGFYVCRWDAREASSGIYYYRIRIGDCIQTKKMLILR